MAKLPSLWIHSEPKILKNFEELDSLLLFLDLVKVTSWHVQLVLAIVHRI